MYKRMAFAAALVLLFLGCAFASGISRSLSASTVQPGKDLTVTLTVTVDAGETFYLIDEVFPSGWTVKNAGTGSAEHAGHIKWAAIENAADTIYTYTLTAPAQLGTGSFAGTYLFEGMDEEAQIAGNKLVSVAQAGPGPGDGNQGSTDLMLYGLLFVGIVLVGIAVAMMLKKKKK